MILVIGAAHFDIVGDYKKASSGVIDKPGEIFYSIGGTAYNVAVNLAQAGQAVKLVSVLKQDSLVKPIILGRLKSQNIDTSLVQSVDQVDESGFMAQRQDGQLITAVSSSTAEKLTIGIDGLSEAIEDSSAVVACCNCSAAFLERLSKACLANGKRLFVAGVSESKARRLLELDRGLGESYPVYCASMNMYEASELGFDKDNITQAEAKRICEEIGCKVLVATDEERGYWILFHSGEFEHHPAPHVPHVVSSTGAGDAVLAAMVDHLTRSDFSFADMRGLERTIARNVSVVLSRQASTMGARTAPKEMDVVPKRELNKLHADLAHANADLANAQKTQIATLSEAVKKDVKVFGSTFSFGNVLALLGLLIAGISFVFGAEFEALGAWLSGLATQQPPPTQ